MFALVSNKLTYSACFRLVLYALFHRIVVIYKLRYRNMGLDCGNIQVQTRNMGMYILRHVIELRVGFRLGLGSCVWFRLDLGTELTLRLVFILVLC